MDNQSSTADVEVVYVDKMQELDESVHYNNAELVKTINSIIRKTK